MAYTVGSYNKAPGDTLKATVNFSPDLPSGETLSSAATTDISGGAGLSVSSTTNDDTTATVTMTGGKAGETYDLLVEGTYSDGQVRGFAIRVIVI
jgi:hypothetical protein